MKAIYRHLLVVLHYLGSGSVNPVDRWVLVVDRLKALAGYPFPLSLLFFPFPSSPTLGRLPSGDPSMEQLASSFGAEKRRHGARRRWPCVVKTLRCSCCCAVCVASVATQRVRALATRLAPDSLAVVFLVWRTLAGKSKCYVCHVGSLVERCDTCLWLLSAWCWLVVSSGEALPESFSVGYGRSFLEPFAVVQNGALVVLVEVLPGPACVASAVLLATVFSLMDAGGLLHFLASYVLAQMVVWMHIVATFWWSHLPLSCFLFELVAPLMLSFPCGTVGRWTCVNVALLCTGLHAWLARVSVALVESPLRWDLYRLGPLVQMRVLHLERFLMLRVFVPQGLGPAWPIVPFQACGFTGDRVGCRLDDPNSEVGVLSSTSAVVLVSVCLCVALVSLEADGAVSYRMVTVRPIGLPVLDHVVSRRCEVSGFGLTSDIFHASFAVYHAVECALVGYPFPLSLLFFPFPSSPALGRLPSGDPSMVQLVSSCGAASWSEEEVVVVGSPRLRIPLVCLSADVAMARRVATSEEASAYRDKVVVVPFLVAMDLLVGNMAAYLLTFSDQSWPMALLGVCACLVLELAADLRRTVELRGKRWCAEGYFLCVPDNVGFFRSRGCGPTSVGGHGVALFSSAAL
ncbi:hypothetical protein Taro_000153 [Colocasia esculenta]|uniref:Uncharacterized protein n=1 Tax=Colocasia esculenta TaxID=4460 RepID=A0A843TBF0_COLES|nr:hypothetical protein [Colocasia esculenta]